MSTKYAKETQPTRGRRHSPYLRNEVAVPASYRSRLNLLMLVSAAMVVFLHSISPEPRETPAERLQGTAWVEAMESQADAAGAVVPGLLLRLEVPGAPGRPVFVPVDPEFIDRYAVGDRVAVLYVSATAFSPARIVEVGVAALPATAPRSGADALGVQSETGASQEP